MYCLSDIRLFRLFLNCLYYLISCLIHFLYHLFQIWAILLGFSYAFVKVKKHEIKFYTFLKIYIYLFDIIRLSLAIYLLIRAIQWYSPVKNLSFFSAVKDGITVISIIMLILLRIREEYIYNIIHKTFVPLQRTYFKYLTHLSTDKTTQIIQVLQTLIIFGIHLFELIQMIDDLIRVGARHWDHMATNFGTVMFSTLAQYTMWHHGFILSYINNILLNLNNQLKNENIKEPFNEIYTNISLILEQVNCINSPIVFCAIFNIVLNHSLYLYSLYSFLKDDADYEMVLLALVPKAVVFYTIYLYFIICQRICRL